MKIFPPNFNPVFLVPSSSVLTPVLKRLCGLARLCEGEVCECKDLSHRNHEVTNINLYKKNDLYSPWRKRSSYSPWRKSGPWGDPTQLCRWHWRWQPETPSLPGSGHPWWKSDQSSSPWHWCSRLKWCWRSISTKTHKMFFPWWPPEASGLLRKKVYQLICWLGLFLFTILCCLCSTECIRQVYTSIYYSKFLLSLDSFTYVHMGSLDKLLNCLHLIFMMSKVYIVMFYNFHITVSNTPSKSQSFTNTVACSGDEICVGETSSNL